MKKIRGYVQIEGKFFPVLAAPTKEGYQLTTRTAEEAAGGEVFAGGSLVQYRDLEREAEYAAAPDVPLPWYWFFLVIRDRLLAGVRKAVLWMRTRRVHPYR